MSRYKKLGNNMLWMFISNFGSKLLNFFLIPMYTNNLSTEEYGNADIIFTTIPLLIPIFTLSIGEAILRFALDRKEKELENYRQNVFSIGFYICLISIVILGILSPFFIKINVLRDYYIYFVFYYIVSTFYMFLAQYAKGTEKIFAFSLWGIVNTFFTVIFNIYFILFLALGIKGYLLSYILGQLIADIGLWIHLKASKQILKFKFIDKELLKSMIIYAIPLIPNTVCWWISNSSDRYMITWIVGSSANGIYSIATKIPSMISVLFNMFIMAWQISAVEGFGGKESQNFYSIINKNYMSLCFILSSAIIALIKPISLFLFSNKFFIAWKIGPILVIACCFHSLGLFLGTIYTGAMKTKNILVSTITSAIINIFLNYFLINWYGAIGAAIATLISYIIIWFYRAIDSKKIMKIQYNVISSILALILLIIEFFIIYLELKYSIFIALVIFLIILYINKEFVKNIILIFKNIFFKYLV